MPQRAAELEPGRRRAQTSRRTSSGALLGTGPDAPIPLEGSTRLEAPGHPNDPLETAESLNSDGASTAPSMTVPTRAALARANPYPANPPPIHGCADPRGTRAREPVAGEGRRDGCGYFSNRERYEAQQGKHRGIDPTRNKHRCCGESTGGNRGRTDHRHNGAGGP